MEESESYFLCCVLAGFKPSVGHCPGHRELRPCVSTSLQAHFLWVNLQHSMYMQKCGTEYKHARASVCVSVWKKVKKVRS